MTAPIISEMWPRFILPIIRKEWFQKMTAVVSPVAGLFGIETSTQSVEYSQGIGGRGIMPEYNSGVAEGAPAAIQYGSFSPLFEKTFTHKEYAKGLAIERKLWDDDRQGNIKRLAGGEGDMAGATISYHQSSVFNNAFSASFVGGDGVALCSATHDVSPSDGTHFVNRGTSALSYAAIVATQILGLGMKADDGTPMPMVYDTIVVPAALQATVLEVTKGSYVPGQADLTASALFYQGQSLKIIVDPSLTDATNWFMLNSAQAKLHLLWFWRVRPEINLDPASNFNLVARYAAYMRMSYGWDDPRFIFGQEVAG